MHNVVFKTTSCCFCIPSGRTFYNDDLINTNKETSKQVSNTNQETEAST